MVETKLNGNVRVFIDRKFIGSEKICGPKVVGFRRMDD